MSDEKNKYITAYGSSNTDSYGRGDVTDVSTKYNMLPKNPLSDENAPEMNSYSSDGSYNQDVFGWKCFNSPVSFRNGIYGECGCVTTFSDNSYHGIKVETYDIGDNSNQSKIIIKADHIKLDGTVDDLTADKANKLVYNTSTVIKAASATSVVPDADGTVSLGSDTNKFKNIYGDIKLNTNLSFTTQYEVAGADSSDAVTTNLTDYNIAIKLPKCTYITTPVDGNVLAVGLGARNDFINLPQNQNTYLAADRVAPFSAPADVGKTCVGTSSRPYDHVWANNLHGCIPTGNASSFPVGCIIMAMATISAFTNSHTYQFGCGATSDITSDGEIFEGGWDPDLNKWSQIDTANLKSSNRVWKTLSGCAPGASSSSIKVPVLIMRIE